MKGMVFRAFTSFIEQRFSDELADNVLDLPELSTGGAYTTVGNYPYTDMLSMAVFVSEKTGFPVSELVNAFGEHLFHVLAAGHKDMVDAHTSAPEFLSVIETVIHRDVRKLYDNTELPSFDVEAYDSHKSVTLLYASSRPFADLAEGLITGCLDYFDVKDCASIERLDLNPDGTRTRFKVNVEHGARPS